MQSIKVVVRQIGNSNPAWDVVSAQEASDYIEYQYGSQGYVLSNSHYLGEVKDGNGVVQGYKVMFVLTKYNKDYEQEQEVPKSKTKKDA